MAMVEEHGYVGNIWVRQNWMRKSGDVVGGHLHYHDHVSLLVQGRVSVEIGDEPAKEFSAPTFIVVRKEHRHRITSLEDNTIWYCVFAQRDINGETADIIDEANLPNYPQRPEYVMEAPDDYWNDKTIVRKVVPASVTGKTWVELDHDHVHGKA